MSNRTAILKWFHAALRHQSLIDTKTIESQAQQRNSPLILSFLHCLQREMWPSTASDPQQAIHEGLTQYFKTELSRQQTHVDRILPFVLCVALNSDEKAEFINLIME